MNQRLREIIFKRDNYTCQYCGAKNISEKLLVLAHIRTACFCGDDRESNLITLCSDCYNHVDNKIIRQKFETAENASIFNEKYKQRVANYGYEVNYTKKVFSSKGIKITRPQIDRFIKKCIKSNEDFEAFKKQLISNPRQAMHEMTLCSRENITYKEYKKEHKEDYRRDTEQPFLQGLILRAER